MRPKDFKYQNRQESTVIASSALIVHQTNNNKCNHQTTSRIQVECVFPKRGLLCTTTKGWPHKKILVRSLQVPV
jgi:hypothetical protein